MEEQPSARVIDQSVRSGIMEALAILADGDDGVRRLGPAEYFESFYDVIPHRDDGEMHPNCTITTEERSLLFQVSRILDDACDATLGNMTADEFIAAGWPERIRPIALKALAIMRERSRFSEDQEEEVPSA